MWTKLFSDLNGFYGVCWDLCHFFSLRALVRFSSFLAKRPLTTWTGSFWRKGRRTWTHIYRWVRSGRVFILDSASSGVLIQVCWELNLSYSCCWILRWWRPAPCCCPTSMTSWKTKRTAKAKGNLHARWETPHTDRMQKICSE